VSNAKKKKDGKKPKNLPNPGSADRESVDTGNTFAGSRLETQTISHKRKRILPNPGEDTKKGDTEPKRRFTLQHARLAGVGSTQMPNPAGQAGIFRTTIPDSDNLFAASEAAIRLNEVFTGTPYSVMLGSEGNVGNDEVEAAHKIQIVPMVNTAGVAEAGNMNPVGTVGGFQMNAPAARSTADSPVNVSEIPPFETASPINTPFTGSTSQSERPIILSKGAGLSFEEFFDLDFNANKDDFFGDFDDKSSGEIPQINLGRNLAH
jgi:hypothetical protein